MSIRETYNPATAKLVAREVLCDACGWRSGAFAPRSLTRKKAEATLTQHRTGGDCEAMQRRLIDSLARGDTIPALTDQTLRALFARRIVAIEQKLGI